MALPTYDQFVTHEAQQVFDAYKKKHGRVPAASDLAHNSWRRLVEGWTHEAILGDILGVPVQPPVVTPPGGTARKGLVRASGRHFVDDTGAFCPAGYTLFWALRGWRNERDRVKQNIQHIAKQGYDYYRVLGQVDWAGLETDPRWPDYKGLLGELIDWSYDVAGIRPQITLIGGDTSGLDWSKYVNDAIEAVRPRAPKVMFVEVANEWFKNFNHEAAMKDYGRRLRENLPNLVALSAPSEEMAWTRSKGWVGVYANATTAHFDRSDNATDWKWRHVRKPWEGRQPDVPSSHNEPGGPASSVAQYPEPIHLVMSRAVGILCGYDSYVLHNGAGIYGTQRPEYGGRAANVWEQPGIEPAEKAVRRLDLILPPNPSEGTATRKGLGAHPLTCDNNWPDGGDHGCVRDYAITNGTSFWQAVQGIKGYVSLKADANYTLDIVDPITHAVESTTVAKGATVRLNPVSRDSRGYGAFIVRGRRI